MTHTKEQQAQQRFADEVAGRYESVVPALQKTLTQLRSNLHAWAGDNAEAHLLVGAVIRKIDADFGAHWADTTCKDSAAVPELHSATATATMLGAHNPLMGFKRMMYNPQLLAQASIMKTAQQLHAESGLPPMIGASDAFMEVVREACRPLTRMPQYDDHQMHL